MVIDMHIFKNFFRLLMPSEQTLLHDQGSECIAILALERHCQVGLCGHHIRTQSLAQTISNSLSPILTAGQSAQL
jgi:hypothetical protein